MTNIELQFYQSAVHYFREHSNNKMSYDQMRFWASAIILSGMCSNYANTIVSSFRAEDAVKLADSLLKILSETSHPAQR